MSEVSRSAPPAAKPAAAPANRAPAGKASEERGDVFSALLSLVAETRAAPAGESSAGGSGAPLDEAEAEDEATPVSPSGQARLPVADIQEILEIGDTTDYGQFEPVPSGFFEDEDPRLSRQAA